MPLTFRLDPANRPANRRRLQGRVVNLLAARGQVVTPTTLPTVFTDLIEAVLDLLADAAVEDLTTVETNATGNLLSSGSGAPQTPGERVGDQYTNGDNGDVYRWGDNQTWSIVANVAGPAGDAGAQGPAGPGVAPGGEVGSILVRDVGPDFTTAWAQGIVVPDPAGLPDGYVLKVQAGQAVWQPQ